MTVSKKNIFSKKGSDIFCHWSTSTFTGNRGKGMKTKHIANTILFLLVVLWSYAATGKLSDHWRFVFQLHLSPLPLIRSLATILSWVVPVTEASVAVALLTGRFRMTGLYSSLLLLVAFEIYIAAMLLSGLHLPCTCGGIISKMGWKQHLFFNGFFIAISFTAIILTKKNKNIPVGKDDRIKGLTRA
jgi:hypothetical protein